MIQLSHIAKSFVSERETVRLFEDLNWEVDTSSYVALMGASGAGKSTLLSLIAGIQNPDSGSILLDGKETTRFSLDEMVTFRGKNFSFIFQSFELLPNLTVKENVDLVIDISQGKRRFETHEILEKVWLWGKWFRSIHELSWGEQQRVAIARAFVSEVPYLLADEPTWNLDEKNAEKIMDLIDTLHAEIQNTIIMITHDHEIARRADTIYRLHGWTVMKNW